MCLTLAWLWRSMMFNKFDACQFDCKDVVACKLEYGYRQRKLAKIYIALHSDQDPIFSDLRHSSRGWTSFWEHLDTTSLTRQSPWYSAGHMFIFELARHMAMIMSMTYMPLCRLWSNCTEWIIPRVNESRIDTLWSRSDDICCAQPETTAPSHN